MIWAFIDLTLSREGGLQRPEVEDSGDRGARHRKVSGRRVMAKLMEDVIAIVASVQKHWSLPSASPQLIYYRYVKI